MRPIIERIKEIIPILHNKLKKETREKNNSQISQLRIKIIGFRDLYNDGDYAFEISRFFYLPEETSEFEKFFNNLEAKGGGDVPENSLEALAMAMQSDWCTTTDRTIRKRQIIVLLTDAPAHPFEKAFWQDKSFHIENMPENFAEFCYLWSGLEYCGSQKTKLQQDAKRMIVFAPDDCEPWNDIVDAFDNSIICYIEPNKRGSDITIESMLKVICEVMR